MKIETILNHVQKFKSFVHKSVRWVEYASDPTIEVGIQPRSNSHPLCSICGYQKTGYVRLPERRFEFIPMWGINVFFVYTPRRVNCSRCGIQVKQMPWVTDKHRLTEAYVWFLAGWAKRLSWSEVAQAFHITWGREHQGLSGITSIGVDNIAWQPGYDSSAGSNQNVVNRSNLFVVTCGGFT
jgi:transposase